MRIMFDKSITQIYEIARKEGFNTSQMLQLRTPLTGYKTDTLEIVKYGLDNGSFSNFNSVAFEKMALKSKGDPLCLWVAMPDVVGDFQSTLALFHHWRIRLGISPKKTAFVLQDGVVENEIPWHDFSCLFLGGTDAFRESSQCWRLLCEAQVRHKWVHIGRVNTPSRIVYFHDIADSCDGSGVARFDQMRIIALNTLKELEGTSQTYLDTEWI